MNRLLSEAVGTFVLVLAGTGAIVVNETSGGAITHVGVALTFGLTVAAMICALGDVSGAHMNPAVSIALGVAGRFPGRAVPGYVAAQLAGALAASLLLAAMFPQSETLGATVPVGPAWRSLVLETVLTAVLVLVILMSIGAGRKTTEVAFAVGAVIGLEALFAGPISGASMNPARSIAPGVVSGSVDSLWVYVAGPVAGAVGATALAAAIAPAQRSPAPAGSQ
jgi:aquaporin Z